MIDVSKIIFGVLCFFLCLSVVGGTKVDFLIAYPAQRWNILPILLTILVDYIADPAQPPFSLRKSIKAVGPGPLYQFRCSERLWIIEAVNGERERRENKD